MNRKRSKTVGTIYLLHFDRPFGHAKHYLGWAENQNWSERIEQHRSGQGSKLMSYVIGAGIGFVVAKLWDNKTRHDERRWKARGKGQICPICLKAKAANKVPATGTPDALPPIPAN